MKPVDSQPSHILPAGMELPHNYIIDKILGEGGFGITYSGTLLPTGERVAIKEYFPNGLAHREQTAEREFLVIPSYGMEEAFEKGRRHFLNEASILKEFQNLNSIVSVKDVIEANGTVYLVMEYIDGITLKQYVKENGALSFQELLPLIKPVIQALVQVHRQGLIHRDISPENLMVGIDNQLHLIDFGAASIENGHDNKTLTVILKSGYAPPEQYLSDGKQGAWTDIYALCATMYMTLTGFAPPESIRRIQQDELPALAEHADITSWQAAAIEKGMNLTAADRFQNMESLYQALIIPPIEMNSKRRSYQNALEEKKTVMKNDVNTKKKRNPLYLGILLVFLFVVIFAGTALFNANIDLSNSTVSSVHCTMIDVSEASTSIAKKIWKKLDNRIHTILLNIDNETEPSTEDNAKSNTTERKSTAKEVSSKKSSSSDNKTTTSEKATESKSNFTVEELVDEYDTFIID
ncbi:MAG: serine/threonine protein kinase [Lachnospiraceae bacterium]|nr:serine/threonine protein kinase [Lachnospiraceae bacterium]